MSAPHVAQHRLRSHTDFFIAVLILWLSKHDRIIVFVALVAGESIKFQRARRAIHAVAARLITHMRNVSPTPFVRRFTHLPPCDRTRQIRDHVISFDVIVK